MEKNSNKENILVLNNNYVPTLEEIDPKSRRKLTKKRRNIHNRKRDNSNGQSANVEEKIPYIFQINKIILIGLFFIFIISLSILLYGIYLLFKKENKKTGEEYEKEKLVTKINYSPDMIFKFRSQKIINVTVDVGETDNENNTKLLTQYIDFFFLIRETKNELDLTNTYIKNVYTGYLGILNATINNGTEDMMIIYDEKIQNFLKNNSTKNFRNIEENIDLKYVGENNKLCFVKIEFYENGEINKIFLPKDFYSSNMIFINNIIKLIIPKIKPNLYSTNIDKKVKEINITNNSEDEIYNIYEEEIDNIWEQEEEETNNTDENEDFGRILDNEIALDENINIENIDEHYTYSSTSDVININLREAKYYNDSNTNEEDIFKEIDNIISNYTILIEYSLNNLDNGQINFENSLVDNKIYTKIDSDGNLHAIKELQNTKLIHNDKDKYDEDNNNGNIYNSNNLISEQDTLSNDEEDNENDTFSFNLSSISLESENNILLYDNFSNKEINKNLFNYFDSFIYVLYNETQIMKHI